MAGIFNGPPRGGTRGGADQFSWDNVKADRDREYYLGHSVKAVTGRWQNGKDVYWYTRDKDGAGGQEAADARRAHEMAMVKQREQDLMMEALGLKPKAPKHTTQQPRLGKEDMQKLLGKDDDEDGGGAQEDRIRGLGFNASRTTGAIQTGVDQERLDGMGLRGGPRGGAPAPPSVPPSHAAGGDPGRGRAVGPSGPGLTADEIAELKRRRRKEDKKAAKRAKKEEKRENKRSKRQNRSQSRSRSPRKDRGRDKDSPSDSGSDSDRDAGRRRRSRSRSVEARRRRHESESPIRERKKESERRRGRSPGEGRRA